MEMMVTLGVWRRLILGVGALALTAAAAFQFGGDWPRRTSSTSDGAPNVAAAPAVAPAGQTPPPQSSPAAVPPTQPPPVSDAGQRGPPLASARSAWAYMRRNYHPSTGFVGATDLYQFVTMWDVGS